MNLRQRKKRSAPIHPVYEIVLNGEEEPRIPKIDLIQVLPAERLELRCTTSGEIIDKKTLSLESSKGATDVLNEENKVSLLVDAFHPALHSAVYECYAKRADGSIHSRKVRLREKLVLKAGQKECPVNDMCFNGGICIENVSGMKECVCPPDHGGVNCDSPVVSDYVVSAAKVAAGTGGTCFIIFFILTIIFGMLFVKERRKRKRIEQKYGPFPESHTGSIVLFEHDPENPYKETCVSPSSYAGVHGQSPSSYANSKYPETRELSRMRQFNNSFKHWRRAVRTRLPGTSDSKLMIEEQPAT